MTNITDPKNIRDRVEFVDTINGGKQTTTKRALQIIFDNMQHNFDRIRDHQIKSDYDIQDLKVQTQVIQNKLIRVDDVEKKVDHLKGEYDTHCAEEKSSNTRVIKSAMGVGGLGVLLVVLQLINLLTH